MLIVFSLAMTIWIIGLTIVASLLIWSVVIHVKESKSSQLSFFISLGIFLAVWFGSYLFLGGVYGT